MKPERSKPDVNDISEDAPYRGVREPKQGQDRFPRQALNEAKLDTINAQDTSFLERKLYEMTDQINWLMMNVKTNPAPPSRAMGWQAQNPQC